MAFSRMGGAAAFFGLALAGLTLAGCGESEAPREAQTPPIPVMVASVRAAPESADVIAYGIVRSDKEGVMSFKIGGLLKVLNVDAGDRIRKGEVLAELDQREIAAEAARARAAAVKAGRDLARIEPLLKKGFVSRQKVQDAQSALAMAQADARRVEFNRSLATITAPADGVVLARHADINEIVAPGTPVLTISQGSATYILKAGLSDRDVAQLAVGDKASVTLDAFPGKTVEGVLRRIGAMSDDRTGTFEIEIALGAAPQGVSSGFMGMARIRPGAGARAEGNTARVLAIPASAILEGHGQSATVYVIDAKTSIAHLKRVSVAGIEGEDILISGGLEPDAQVVSAGAPYLRDGAKVKIVTDLAGEIRAPEPRT